MPPSKKPGWIDWEKSRARQIILQDLMRGVLSTDDDDPTPQEAWNTMYEHLVEFQVDQVLFEQFEKQLKAHRQQVRRLSERSMWEAAALEHDRELHPRNTVNLRGETVFELSAAKDLLREDIEEGKNLEMSSTQLRGTREEYNPPHLNISNRQFKDLVRQQANRKKYYDWKADKDAKEAERTWVPGMPPDDPQPPGAPAV